MGKLNVISAISALALIGITAYLVYAGLADYREFKEVSRLSQQFYTEDVHPEQLDARIAEVREHIASSPSPPLRLLLFDLLLFRSYYYPDDCSEPLAEALGLGEELYRTLNTAHGPIGAQLAFGYLYAGLPSKLPDWGVEVAAHDPQYRAQLTLLTFLGYIQSDDIAAAQSLVDAAADEYGESIESRAMLTAAYHLLGLEHESRQFALEDEQLGDMSSNIRLNYARFLLESGKYVEAEDLLRQNLKDLGGDPGRSLELALCLTVIRGIDDAEVGRLLDTAARSTRDPMSADGARAVCLGAAYALDGDTARAEQLLELARRQPDDYHVRSAVAALALEFQRREVNLGASADVIRGYPGIDDPVALARQLLEAADTPGRLQDARLQLALALTYLAQQSPGQQRGILAEAAEQLRAALSAGAEADQPETDRIPDYDIFLLDPAVRELRGANPDFDTEVHHAVVDLLNQRRAMFKDVVDLPPLEY